MFEHTSRYALLATNTLTMANGANVTYVRRRFLPQGAQMTVLDEIVISEGERLDLLSHRAYGDAEQYWRICDANNALRPEDLTSEVGRSIRIPVPEL